MINQDNWYIFSRWTCSCYSKVIWFQFPMGWKWWPEIYPEHCWVWTLATLSILQWGYLAQITTVRVSKGRSITASCQLSGVNYVQKEIQTLEEESWMMVILHWPPIPNLQLAFLLFSAMFSPWGFDLADNHHLVGEFGQWKVKQKQKEKVNVFSLLPPSELYLKQTTVLLWLHYFFKQVVHASYKDPGPGILQDSKSMLFPKTASNLGIASLHILTILSHLPSQPSDASSSPCSVDSSFKPEEQILFPATVLTSMHC